MTTLRVMHGYSYGLGSGGAGMSAWALNGSHADKEKVVKERSFEWARDGGEIGASLYRFGLEVASLLPADFYCA